MKSLLKMTATAAVVAGAALLASAPANAQVGIHIGGPGFHIGVGVPAHYYGRGYYPPGPCDGYNYYYEGDCGYDVYNGQIYIDGMYVGGPHYYRWYGDRPYFWYRGGWHNWDGWHGAHFGWHHNEGWGWHGGHWDRGWGAAHWHGGPGGVGHHP